MQALPVVGPTVEFPVSQILQAVIDAVAELQAAQLTTVTSAGLPPADQNRACMVHVSDKNCIAISTPVAGVYTWLRADGSAL